MKHGTIKKIITLEELGKGLNKSLEVYFEAPWSNYDGDYWNPPEHTLELDYVEIQKFWIDEDEIELKPEWEKFLEGYAYEKIAEDLQDWCE